jgi:predicted CXXCH cytochrome family protein
MLKKSSIVKLCVSCHTDKKKLIKKSTKNVHPPVKKNCAACHDPHAGKNKERLKADKRREICLTCHKDKKKWIKNVKNKHGAINLKNGGCIACHDPHYTGKRKMLKGKTTKDLCLSCHNKELTRDEDGKKLQNIKKHLQNNKKWHSPVKQGNCTSCHNPHGSNNHRMLKGPYPTKSITPFKPESYICFNCHQKEKITQRKTTTQTNFRIDEKNLHTIHVKDRSIVCTTCHDVHGAKEPNPLIKNKTQFSGTEFKLRYIKTPDGGSCNPICHNKKEYSKGFSSRMSK